MDSDIIDKDLLTIAMSMSEQLLVLQFLNVLEYLNHAAAHEENMLRQRNTIQISQIYMVK